MRTTSSLALEQAPPISVPFRFFLTAPLFGMGAGLLLLLGGPAAVASRWSMETLALTHLLTLGFLALAMCGAMLQVLPVLAGVPVPGVKRLGATVHLLLSLGTALLVAGFLNGSPGLLQAGMAGLGAGFAVFLVGLLIAFRRVALGNPTVTGMALAGVALLVTLILGTWLAGGISGAIGPWQPAQLTRLHLVWGLLGWVGLPIVAVAYQVVPMFQMTAEYPAAVRRWLTGLLFTGLLAWSVLAWVPEMGLAQRLSLGPITTAYAAFAVLTLMLQARRRRRRADVHLGFWRLGATAMLLCYGGWVLALTRPELSSGPGFMLLMGAGLVLGVALSIVNGMLYKIVPFLAWFHLQHRQVALFRQRGRVRVPHMQALLPDTLARRQFGLHLGVLLLSVPAVVAPTWFVRPLGATMAISFALLEWNLMRVMRRYRQVDRELTQAVADAADSR